MAINGIKIEVGQKWRDRAGDIGIISESSDPDYPWDTGCGATVTDAGKQVIGERCNMGDLIELIEHADGFKPWAGGEQPEETRGKLVVFRMDNGETPSTNADVLDWRALNDTTDIVAYKVIAEAAQPVGEFASAASYSDHMAPSGSVQPDPLHVEMIEPPQDALDVQVGGDHYKSLAIQPVEYIHANKIGYFEGNVIKYVTRWRAKNGVADLEKAKHYIDLLIELEGGAK